MRITRKNNCTSRARLYATYKHEYTTNFVALKFVLFHFLQLLMDYFFDTSYSIDDEWFSAALQNTRTYYNLRPQFNYMKSIRLLLYVR